MGDFSVVDLFCGVGGLTHGFVAEGFDVVAGFDSDESCKYAYEANNRRARFVHCDIDNVTPRDISALYPKGYTSVLVGCAPCQPYSSYTKKKNGSDGKWKLLSRFADLICAVKPDVVSMENVPDLVTFKGGRVYDNFVASLKTEGYQISAYPDVYCPDYGVPQQRKRLVLFASKYGGVQLVEGDRTTDTYATVWETIGNLDPLEAGQVSEKDTIHRASRLSELNLRRIQASAPGGTWRDWPEELIAECHKKQTGKYYNNIYGRMEKSGLAPTITTQCYGFGNGRFGHPTQDRAISLREAALLQTFPPEYQFVEPGKPVYFKVIARQIGNAVPVELARAIARSIERHLERYAI